MSSHLYLGTYHPFGPVFSPKYRVLPTYPQSYPHYPQNYPHSLLRFYTEVIPTSIHIIPRFKTVFFFKGVLFYITKLEETSDNNQQITDDRNKGYNER